MIDAIRRVLSNEITENQTQECYTFESGKIIWVPAEECYMFKHTDNSVTWATPGDVDDLLNTCLDDQEIQDWFDEQYEDYAPSDIAAIIMEAAE